MTGARRRGVLHIFQEKVKELAARLLQDESQDEAALMREVAAILPSAWQHPAAAEARISWGGQEFRTPGFQATPWRLSAAFAAGDGRRGLVEVAYLRQFPDEAEGPFLAEERKLIDFLAELLRGFVERKIAHQALVESRDSSREQLRALAAELSLTAERERRALACDLHDHIGQTLAAAKIRLAALPGSPAVGEIRSLLDEAIRRTRSLTFELSSPVLYELGLEPALESLAERMQEKHGLAVEFQDDGAAKPLGDETKVILYKAARELLMNVVKHSGASRAAVRVRRAGARVELSVEDDGVGLGPPKSPASPRSGGFGLFSIREGLRHCGGEFSIKPGKERGTQAVLLAPLSEAGAGS